MMMSSELVKKGAVAVLAVADVAVIVGDDGTVLTAFKGRLKTFKPCFQTAFCPNLSKKC